MFRFSTIFFTIFISCSTAAQKSESLVYGESTDFPKILATNYLNDQLLIKQRNRVEDITRKNFGKSLKIGNKNIPLLQRILDENIVDAKNTLTLQALGVVLGDVFVDTHRNFEWKVYEDELGKSLAVCVKSTKECLFPVTMISKRVEAGTKPDVANIYKKGLDAMQPFLPKLPFSGSQ